MKIVVDMNLSPLWATFLVDQGFEAVHWSTVGDARAADLVLLAWARDTEHVVFTNDLDFGVLLAMAGAAGPSVLQVRTLDLTPDAIGSAVVRVLHAHEDVLRRGALVTLDARTARVRILPIQQTRPG